MAEAARAPDGVVLDHVEATVRAIHPGIRARAVTVGTPAGEPAIALVVADPDRQLALVALHAELERRLVRDSPLAYGVVPALAELGSSELTRAGLARQIRAGSITLSRVDAAGPSRDLGPRAVRDLDWVRSFRLSLGRHAKGSVNAYLVSTEEGPVLIDTGFVATAEELMSALSIAGVGRGELRAVFATHNHADHVGAANSLRAAGWLAPDAPILMHELTEFIGRRMFVEHDQQFVTQLMANGIHRADLDAWVRDVQELADLADWPADPQLIQDKEQLRLGEVRFEFCYTPGHSPDHTAVIARRDDGRDAAFLGDLTLGNGMPMCGMRDWLREDPIGDLLGSWQYLLSQTDGVGLPGHGRPIADLGDLHADLTRAYATSMVGFRRQFGGHVISAADAMAELVAPDAPFAPKQFAFYGSLARLHHLALTGAAELVGTEPRRYLVKQSG